MQHLLYVLFQLDEARRHILDGRLERLRLALLLLDNACEIQLDRQVQAELMSERMREKLRSHALQIPAAHRAAHLSELATWEPLSTRQKKRLEKYFDEKVRYLAERWSKLDPRLVDPLRHLHGYRNEAYHRAKVRRETVRTAAVLYFEINCLILPVLPGWATVYSSDEDYSWITERFGLEPKRMWFRDELPTMIESLRADVVPNVEAVTTALAEHAESRFEDLYDALDFVVQNTDTTDRSQALRASQYWYVVRQGKLAAARTPIDAFVAQYSLPDIEALRRRVDEVRAAEDRIDAFDRFAQIERALEPIERPVVDSVDEVELMIQHEIDRARGK
jgi:hypothetical protein